MKTSFDLLMTSVKNFLKLLVLVLLVSACKNTDKEQKKNTKLRITVTTGMIRDAVLNIGGDYIEVQALMGPGVDPHLYKPTRGDLEKLRSADLILYNGLRLEGKMTDIFEKLARNKTVIAVSDKIPENKFIQLQGTHNVFDPHIWFDVSLWQEVVKRIAAVLEKQDPVHAPDYRKNLTAYLQKLDSLHIDTKKQIADIPKEQRVLVTSHDVFGYFGKAYGVEVKGLQGISTVSEFGLKDITDLADFIIQRKIKAVFTETSVSAKSIEAVVKGCEAKDHKINIGRNLYSDAMGNEGTFEGTYIGMVSYNTKAIVNALK